MLPQFGVKAGPGAVSDERRDIISVENTLFTAMIV